MPVLHLARLGLHLAVGLGKCALLFPWLDDAGRERRIQRWSRQLIAICGVRLVLNEVAQPVPASPALIISNHISWLDIFVVLASHPSVFVAKSEIRQWPLVGWLCARVGTLFIERGRRSATRHVNAAIVTALQGGIVVGIYPEGTTSDGLRLLQPQGGGLEVAVRSQGCYSMLARPRDGRER